MTEKRFHFGYVLGDTGLIDEQSTEHKWFIENCCSVSDLKKNWKTVCDKLNEVAKENEQLKKENQRMTDKLNELALEFLNYDMVTMGKATEISEMCYYDFLKYRKDNGNPMELQL